MVNNIYSLRLLGNFYVFLLVLLSIHNKAQIRYLNFFTFFFIFLIFLRIVKCKQNCLTNCKGVARCFYYHFSGLYFSKSKRLEIIMKEFKELTKQELEQTSGGVAMPVLWFFRRQAPSGNRRSSRFSLLIL